MNRKIKAFFIVSVLSTAFSLSELALAIPEIANYKLNGKEESVKFNPSLGDVVNIEINTNVPVKFSRIAICEVTDSNCGDGIRYFTYSKKDDPYILSITKVWDGKTTDGTVVPNGDYKIKVKMKDEVSTEYKYIQDLSSYVITIDSSFAGGSGGSSSSVSSESSSSQSSSFPSGVSNSGSSSFISTHSGTEELSVSSKSSSRFETNSGRDRLAYSGAPITFDGEVSVPKDLYGKSVKFVWSFGDGSSAEGKKVSHIYKFIGDYVVVLNASLLDFSAVSRTGVKVVNPSVVISNVSSDSVEIWNKGIFEINLNGWFISNDHGKFIFSQDTIIGPNKKITIPDEYMKLNLAQGKKTYLLNPSQKEISSSSSTLAVNFSDLDNDPVVKKIREFIVAESKSSLGDDVTPIFQDDLSDKTIEVPVVIHEKSIEGNKKIVPVENNKIISSSTQTASVASSQIPPRGFIRSLFNLPYGGFSFIKRVFYSDN